MSDVNPAVGIDLGTTNTVVSVQTDSLGPRILEIPQPQYERKQFDNLSQIKSAVYFESEATAVVGSFASERLESFRSIKSHMGTRWQAIHPYAEHPLTPAYLSAHILGLAHQSILKQFPRWDRTALITVPASFNTDQRNDTISAARMAGFRDIRLLDEPTAAFCYFFSQHSDSDFKEMRSILVFDFGGGTLDVSIIEINAAKDGIIIDTFGRSRYNNLGGDDIDLELAVFLIACWEYDTGNDLKDIPTELRSNIYKLFINKSRLYKEEVEDYLKNELGMPEFYIKEKIPKAGKEREIAFKRILNRSQYEEITGRYFQSKSELNIYRPIEEAVSVANKIKGDFLKNNLDLVLYTGGASNMAGVKAALKSYFAPVRCYSISEEDACNTVALGAACCRYEEIHNIRKITMTSRLLESLFTRKPGDKNYTLLVPLQCEPSETFKKVEGNFELLRPTINLKLPLFRGTSTRDHQLSPMRDIEFPLSQIIDGDVKYSIFYRMTMNKTIELKVEFETINGPIEAIASVDLLLDTSGKTRPFELCKINPV